MSYEFKTVSVPGASDGTWLGGINNAGEVTGYDGGFGLDHYPHAFTYADGTFTPITVAFSINQATGNGINNAGQVVGNAGTPPIHVFGYQWSPDGTVQKISSIPDGSPVPTELFQDKAYGINDSGQVVGADFQHGGFVWQNGNFSFFQVPNATTAGHGINDAGVIVGTANNYGFVDVSGQFGLFGLGATTEVNAINNNPYGEVAGDYFDGNHWHGFIDNAGQMTFIDAPGASDTFIEGINDKGDISGSFTPASGGPVQGFIGIDPDPVATMVREDYVGELGHDADPGGLSWWTNALKTGAVTPRDFVNVLAYSPEAVSQHGGQTDEQYVNSVYLNALGRPAEVNTQTAWASVMQSGASRGDVLSAIATSPEGQIHFAATHG